MKKSVILLGLTLCIFGLWAQNGLSEYNFSYSVNPYQEIADGTILGSETTVDRFFINPGNFNGSSSVLTGPGFPIGFEFRFDGYRFDRIGISSNGWISLGNSALGTSAINMTTISIHNPLASEIDEHPNEVLIARIAGFARQLRAQPGSSIRIKEQGTAPNRELIVQWKHHRRRDATGESLNFQICLQEQGMQVCTRYDLMQVGTQCAGEIGLRAAPAATATNFANRTTLDGWASSQPGLSANLGASLTSTNYPVAGATFTWSPVPNIHIQMQGNDAVISWDPILVDESGNSFIPQYYQLYSNSCSTSSEDFSFLAQIPYPQTTYTHTGVGLGASRMMYRVKAVRLDD